jgi:hypothetical protein
MSSENNDIEKYIDENSPSNDIDDFNQQLVPNFPFSCQTYWGLSVRYMDFIKSKDKYLLFRESQNLSLYLYKSLNGDIYVISKVRGEPKILGYTTPKDFFGNYVDPKIFENSSEKILNIG